MKKKKIFYYFVFFSCRILLKILRIFLFLSDFFSIKLIRENNIKEFLFCIFFENFFFFSLKKGYKISRKMIKIYKNK
jgi:hypothetical protein